MMVDSGLFIKDLNKKKPDIAYIEDINVIDINTNTEYKSLNIIKSEEERGISLTLPPDIAICKNCLADMRNTSFP